MTNISVIENKISTIKKYLTIVKRYKKYSGKQIKQDLDIRGAVERYLYLVVQATIDLADALVAFKHFRKPSTPREPFEILNEEKLISSALAEKLMKMVGFRNILAHDYEKIDYDIVYDILQKQLKDIECFIKRIQK